MPNIRWLLALITWVHRWLYLASDGRLGGRGGRLSFLLLGHTGRRSGRRFWTPLLFVPDGERFLVVASNAGDDREPQWWRNLKAQPETEIRVGRARVAVRAREAGPEERDALWERVLAVWSEFARYRRRTSREIPIVVLEPVARPG